MDESSTMSFNFQNVYKPYLFRPFGYVDLNLINGICSITYKEPCQKCGALYQRTMNAKSFIAESLKTLGDMQKDIDFNTARFKFYNLYN